MEEHAHAGGGDGVGAAGALDDTGCDALGVIEGGAPRAVKAPSRGEPGLRIELPEILRVHLLEVLLELVGLERRIGRGLLGLDAALIE